VVLVLALLGSVQALCGGTCRSGHCVGSVCSECIPNYYLDSGTCVACSVCPTGQYTGSGCQGNVTGDSVCADCARTGPCPNTTYYDSNNCGAPGNRKSDGCVACAHCVDSAGARNKNWGLCGGPSPWSYHPESECMNPGPALCELCSDYVPEWAFTQNEDPELNISFCTNERDASWIYLSGKIESDLISCCHDAKDLEDNGDCEFDVPSPVAARKSCLYNSVITCMGIYEQWPFAHAYPNDPLPW